MGCQFLEGLINENPKLVNLGESALAPCVADKGLEIPQLR